MGPFDVIVADPPWRFASNSDAKPGRNARRHYDTLQLPDIQALPVAGWAADDAVLFLWVTVPHLEQAFSVIRAWGFAYKSNICWDKQRIGTGYWTRNEHEHVLIARRGKWPTPPAHLRRGSVIRGGRREHSRKPDELQDWIDATWPEARRLEMFARQRRLGWTAWGKEVEKYGGAHA